MYATRYPHVTTHTSHTSATVTVIFHRYIHSLLLYCSVCVVDFGIIVDRALSIVLFTTVVLLYLSYSCRGSGRSVWRYDVVMCGVYRVPENQAGFRHRVQSVLNQLRYVLYIVPRDDSGELIWDISLLLDPRAKVLSKILLLAISIIYYQWQRLQEQQQGKSNKKSHQLQSETETIQFKSQFCNSWHSL